MVTVFSVGYHQLISIVDPSLDVEHAKLMCQLFADDEADLPGVTETGQIVRFHRLKVEGCNLFSQYTIH